MFVRIDKDLSVNIQNIFSYKISEDSDSFKLQVWNTDSVPTHTVIYLKNRIDQMQLLIEFNNIMRDLTANLEVIKAPLDIPDEETNRHIEEVFEEDE